MRILLDTCTFLWYAGGSSLLSRNAAEWIDDSDNELFLSVASAWEIAVKYGSRRLILPEPPETYIPGRRMRGNIASLPLVEESAFHAAHLPRLHNDPFDRMLVCQSIVHGLAILSPDALLAQYPVRMLW